MSTPITLPADQTSLQSEQPDEWTQFDRIYKPTRSWVPLDLSELWRYRELLYFLAWRDIKVRYKQTILGILWAVIQPFFKMVVFSIFFGQLAGIGSEGKPYPIFAFAALLPWGFFENGLTQSADSLVGNANLIKKVYFPRLLMPLAGLTSGLIDFAISMFMMAILMAYYQIVPTVNILWLPAFLLLAFVTSLGVGLWLSALNVQFRDVRYTLGFLSQIWLFCTPIAYSSSLIQEPWRSIYGLNPMAGVVEGFRWALLDTPPPGPLIGISAVASTLMLVGGAFYFRRMEKSFADQI